MQIVDTVKVHVLCVPSKSGLPHAKVEVGSVDTLYNNATFLLHHIQQCVEVADVPLTNVLKGEHKRCKQQLQFAHHTWSGSTGNMSFKHGILKLDYN